MQNYRYCFTQVGESTGSCEAVKYREGLRVLRRTTNTCATQLVPYQRVNIFGTKGRIEIEIPFNTPADRSYKLWLVNGARSKEVTLEICNRHTIQGDLFPRAVLEDREVPVPLEDAVANTQCKKKIEEENLKL